LLGTVFLLLAAKMFFTFRRESEGGHELRVWDLIWSSMQESLPARERGLKPKSKKKRIRKKWRKNLRNFRKLLGDQFEDIQIVESFRLIETGGQMGLLNAKAFLARMFGSLPTL